MFDIFKKTEEDKRQEKTDKIERFFAADMCVKKDMHSLVPTDADLYTMDAMVEYMDMLYRGLKDLRTEFKFMGRNIDLGKDTLGKMDAFFKGLIDESVNLRYDPSTIKKFFNDRVSYMREEFVNDVKMNFAGYTSFADVDSYFQNCTTINEALHLLHMYVTNNVDVLHSMSVIGNRDIGGYSLTLYGKPNSEVNEIYNSYPSNTGGGDTDLISLPNVNKALMMVRDKGHALSIEITYEGDNAVVEYFVPKICNIDMVNALPGVIKINSDTPMNVGTTGRFVVSKKELPAMLGNFVSKVPTDADMPAYNYSGTVHSI